MKEAIITIFHFLKHFGLVGIFASMFVENIGIPLPTELGYLLGQEMINEHRYSFLLILFVLTMGHLSGALLSYQLGRLGDGYVAKKLKNNKKIQEVRSKLIEWYKKYGIFAVFITRFVGYVRPWSSFVAGFAEVPFIPFVIWTALGSLLFNIFVLYFSGILILVWRKFAVLHAFIAIVMFFLFFAFIIYELLILFSNKKKNGKSPS